MEEAKMIIMTNSMLELFFSVCVHHTCLHKLNEIKREDFLLLSFYYTLSFKGENFLFVSR